MHPSSLHICTAYALRLYYYARACGHVEMTTISSTYYWLRVCVRVPILTAMPDAMARERQTRAPCMQSDRAADGEGRSSEISVLPGIDLSTPQDSTLGSQSSTVPVI